jgi:hypothetical protein
MPDRNINLASDALWNLVPIHVPASLLYSPDDLPETRCASNHISEGDGTCSGDQSISSGLNEKVDKRGMGLVVWDQDGGEAIESAGKESCQKLDTVGEVDSDPLRTMVLQVLANDANLLAYAVHLVLRDTLLAKDGHDGGCAARSRTSFERDFASDALPDIPKIAVLASRVHWGTRRLHGKASPEGVFQLSAWQRQHMKSTYSHEEFRAT